MVLGQHGYETAVKGKNGFVCLVWRSWTAGTDDPDFWNPKLRAPICRPLLAAGSKQLMLDAIIVAALVAVAAIPLFGWLSDIFGRRALYFAGTLFTMGFAFPLFWLLDSKNPTIIIPTMVVGVSLGQGTMFGLQSTDFPELFGTRVRHRRLARVPACGRHRRRADATVRHVAGEGHRRHRRRLADADPLAAITFVAALCAPETKGRSLHR